MSGDQSRKESAPKYTPERASMILAEAELFGDRKTCEKWQITRQTLHNYRCKLQNDDELLQLFTLKKRLLLVDWQADATKCIKIALARLNEIIPSAETEEHGKVIYAIAGAVKVVGELKIAHDALTDEPANYREGKPA